MIKIGEKWKVVEDIDYFIAFTEFGEGFDGSNKPKVTDHLTGKIIKK